MLRELKLTSDRLIAIGKVSSWDYFPAFFYVLLFSRLDTFILEESGFS